MITAFVDVDTQLDFVCAAGALYTSGAEELADTFAALTKYASANTIRLFSTTDAHAEDDPEFETWKPHCVTGTFGQQKLAATLLEKRYLLQSAPGSLNETTAAAAQQIIIEKQHVDCFTNPNLLPLLRIFAAERYVVYGLVTEVCVLHAAGGLLKTGARVEIVTDAIRAFDEAAGAETLQSLARAGAVLTTVASVTAR